MINIFTISFCFMGCFAGLAYVVSSALTDGAEAYSGEYSEDTARQFEDIFLFIPPRRLAELGWAAAATSFLLFFLLAGQLASSSSTGFLTGTVLGLAVAAFMLRLPRMLLAILSRRRADKFNNQLVDTLITMSNALKAGFSILQTFESVARDGENPIAQEFNVFLQQTRLGVNFNEALHNMEARVGSEDLTLVVLSIETARQTGGNLTEVFEQISATIRERMRIEGRIKTLTAQQRMQGRVVSAMPVFILVAMLALQKEIMLPFLQSTVGLISMASVVLLITMGSLMIRKIMDIDI
jgi:tight adherence protein B